MGKITARVRAVPLVASTALVALIVAWKMHARSHAPVTPSVTSVAVGGIAEKNGIGAGSPPESAPVRQSAPRMLHEDARHTHRSRGMGPREAKLAWSLDVGGPVEAQVVTSPDEQTLYVASLGGTLVAIDRAGKKLWTAVLGDRAYATPCVADDGTIYVGSDAKKIFAITPAGQTKWALDVDGEGDTGCVLGSDGLVVVGAGSTLYGIRSGGDVAWRFAAKGKIFAAPAIADDGRIAFGSQDDHAYMLTPKGALAWSTDLGADVDGAPVIGDDGAIYFGTDAGEVVKLDGAGVVQWRGAEGGGFVRGALSLARNGDVLAGTYGPAPRVVRLHAKDGSLAGERTVPGTGAREFGVHGAPLEDARGALFFGTQRDEIVAIAPDGTTAWTFPTRGDVDAPLTLLSSGDLVGASDDGKVYFFSR